MSQLMSLLFGLYIVFIISSTNWKCVGGSNPDSSCPDQLTDGIDLIATMQQCIGNLEECQKGISVTRKYEYHLPVVYDIIYMLHIMQQYFFPNINHVLKLERVLSKISFARFNFLYFQYCVFGNENKKSIMYVAYIHFV